MDIKMDIGILAAILVAIISALIFLSLYISYGEFSLVYIGIISIVFSGISYIMHAFLRSRRVVNIFVGSYYVIGILSLLAYLTVIKFNLNGIILLLIFILFSSVLIYWRYALQ